MATLIPPSNVEAAYEDMFKEITRKLYGEETGNGLHTLGTPVAQVATTGPTAPEGERSFTNLQIDRSSAPTIEYEHNAAGTAATTAAVAAAAQNANVVIQQQPEGSVVVATTGGNFKSEDHLSTAFGLAALMQNGFATTGTILSTQAINKVVTNAGGQQQQSSGNVTVSGDQQQRWSADGTTTAGNDQQQQQQQPQIVQWTTGGKLQSYTTTQQQQQQQVQTPKTKTKNRNDHATAVCTTEVIYTSPPTSGNTLNAGGAQQQTQQQTTPTSNGSNASSSVGGGSSRKKSHGSSNGNNQQNGNNNNNGVAPVQKRYPCSHCPYSTDRRDLYTRHENIHKDEKPFQCYACLKQFNRADHVKKHFMRMHREMTYDINKTRRNVSTNAANRHTGGRSNVTITTVNATTSNLSGSPEQKPNIFHATNVQIDNAFLESQRQPTSSSLSIAETIEAVATAADAPLPQLKQEKLEDGQVVGGGTIKPKREKRFICGFCPWMGTDKWGLKRHLNTHTKPFICQLCEYKAARAERLVTHVLKVHNKHVCSKCAYLGDTQEEYQAHLRTVHPHDNRPSRNSNNSNNTNNTSNNLNVLRTIGNTLVTNNQLNTFQNTSTTFGNTTTTTTNAIGNAGGSVTIYTTTTTNDNGNGNITGGGPLQEIIVNPTSMVGWRLSANGSLIPPHDLLTGNLPNAAAQKRGSERLFQYLEADGSDPEDYARLLKMDAISRNTASVAQDFRKAGGVHELKIPTIHQLLLKNKLPSQWTTHEAAALLQSLSSTSSASEQLQQLQQRFNYEGGQNGRYVPQIGMRARQYSTGEDDENTPSSSAASSNSDENLPPMKHKQKRRKAMTAFLTTDFDLQGNSSSSNINIKREPHDAADMLNTSNGQQQQQHVNDDVLQQNEVEDQENRVQLIKSSPAYKNLNNNKTNNQIKTKSRYNNNNNAGHSNNNNNQHRHEFNDTNKENDNQHSASMLVPSVAANNSTSFLTAMEYQKMNNGATHFQDYIKEIINKFYVETPQLFNATMAVPSVPPQPPVPQTAAQQLLLQEQQQLLESPSTKRRRMISETEHCIEYLKNKEDITLTITPKTTAEGRAKVGVEQTRRSPSKRQRALNKSRQQSPKIEHIKQEPQEEEQEVEEMELQPEVQLQELPEQLSQQQHKNLSSNKARKSISQLATLLPLLADAASKQQYLATPLDFSLKPENTQPTIVTPLESALSTTSPTPTASTTTPTLGTPAQQTTYFNSSTTPNSIASQDKRSSRKQAQPKKMRFPPEVVVAMLRDKYLNRMVVRKLSCCVCAKSQRSSMLVFNYHTKGSLALHRRWKHKECRQQCAHCDVSFKHHYSLLLHNKHMHGRRAKKSNGEATLKIRVKSLEELQAGI